LGGIIGLDALGRTLAHFGEINTAPICFLAVGMAFLTQVPEWTVPDSQHACLQLLSRVTRAIGERQDLRSIYQVVIRSLEDQLPVDFGCVCAYDELSCVFTITCVGVNHTELAHEFAGPGQALISINENDLAGCLLGDFIYEPDIARMKFPCAKRLAEAGLRSMVISPLLVESQVFGVLITARREAGSFNAGECEFLRQLSAHTALAAHQAQIYGALQRAYDDLHQTQHAIMQQERLRALGEMASGVAHDINNGLSPIMLYTSSLLEHEKNLSDLARDNLKIVQRAGADISATIARLHEFYQQREPQLFLEPVQLNSLVTEVVSLTRARWHDMAEQRGIEIDVRTALPPRLPLVMGVESEIREALVNIILNAVDAMPSGGTITVSTKAASGRVNVQVADTGLGMDTETRRRCLEPFFTTKGERGTGLGLAMVRGIVKRHGGDVEIDSASGKGTKIKMLFPAAPRFTADIVKSSSENVALPRLRLLVVDDDPLILKAVRDTLEPDGHIVETANGGQAGIDAFKSSFARYQSFAAVITDLGMPYVDGRAVASAIKAASPTTPVILLTGWGRRLKAENEIPEHVDTILNKPPKLSELRAALARSLRPV
jgi:signal transduction histidine kinase/ActR/RegA family two-component response regulator